MAIWRVRDTIYITNPHPIRGDAEVATREGRSTRVYLKVGRPYFQAVSIEGALHAFLEISYTYRVEEMAGDNTTLEVSGTHSFPVLLGLCVSAKINATAYEKTWIVQGQHFERMNLPLIPGTLVHGGTYVIDTKYSNDQVLVGASLKLLFEVEYDRSQL